MRVSQIQNLTWAGNVLVLAGLVWVGLQFWEARKPRAATETVWPKVGRDPDVKSRWPGEISAFEQIWKTPIAGKVPPPPVKATEAVVKVDRATEFKQKLKYLSGWEFVGRPELSTALVSFDNRQLSVSPGAFVGDFQLIQFTQSTVVKPETHEQVVTAKLVFRHPDTGAPVVWEGQAPQPQSLVAWGGELFKKSYSDNVSPGDVPENGPLDTRAFQDPVTNDWIVPVAEQNWLAVWGEKDLLAKVATTPVTDAAGQPKGLKVTSIPESGTPLAPTHGIAHGDVVKSINGVPVGSKEDILGYLRGDGKGLERYEVVVETDGRERKLVYSVRRPRRVARD